MRARAPAPSATSQATTLGEAPATGSSVLRFPQAIAYSPGASTILVADQYGSVVQRFDRTGAWLGELGGYADAAPARAHRRRRRAGHRSRRPRLRPGLRERSRAGLRVGHGAVAGRVGEHRHGRGPVPPGRQHRRGRDRRRRSPPPPARRWPTSPTSTTTASRPSGWTATPRAIPATRCCRPARPRATWSPRPRRPRWGAHGDCSAGTCADPFYNQRFNYPQGVAVDAATGHVLVADDDNHRVVEFLSDGTYVRQIGSYGVGAGPVPLPLRRRHRRPRAAPALRGRQQQPPRAGLRLRHAGLPAHVGPVRHRGRRLRLHPRPGRGGRRPGRGRGRRRHGQQPRADLRSRRRTDRGMGHRGPRARLRHAPGGRRHRRGGHRPRGRHARPPRRAPRRRRRLSGPDGLHLGQLRLRLARQPATASSTRRAASRSTATPGASGWPTPPTRASRRSGSTARGRRPPRASARRARSRSRPTARSTWPTRATAASSGAIRAAVRGRRSPRGWPRPPGSRPRATRSTSPTPAPTGSCASPGRRRRRCPRRPAA